MQGVTFKEAYQVNSLTSAKNSVWLDKLDISINSHMKELKMLAHSLGGFIRFFKLYMCHVLNVSIEIDHPNDDIDIYWKSVTCANLQDKCLQISRQDLTGVLGKEDDLQGTNHQ